MKVSITDQLACARRELALRRQVYPVWVKSGKLTSNAAETELERMQAIVETLDKLLGLEEVSLSIRGEQRKATAEELFG